MAFAQVTTYPGAVDRLLKSPGSDVARELGKFGTRLESRAKRSVTGPPHGYYRGTRYPSAPGNPPGLRSGRLRGSIGWQLQYGSGDITLLFGASAYYAIYLEKGSGNHSYPFLAKAVEAEGGTIIF